MQKSGFASQEKPWTPGKAVVQKVSVNIPAYELTMLTTYAGDRTVGYSLPVSVGSAEKPTPVFRGFVKSKIEKIIFRESLGCPVHSSGAAANAPDKIEYHHSFDANGRPVFFAEIDYKNARAVSAGSPGSRDVLIYSLLNPNAVGIPFEGPCIGLSLQDMMSVYDDLQTGENNAHFKTTYDVVEFRSAGLARPAANGLLKAVQPRANHSMDRAVVLHADIYSRVPSYYDAFMKAAGSEGIDLSRINEKKAGQLLKLSGEGFLEAHDRIRYVLSKGYPNNFIKPLMKSALHKRMSLSEFLR